MKSYIFVRIIGVMSSGTNVLQYLFIYKNEGDIKLGKIVHQNKLGKI